MRPHTSSGSHPSEQPLTRHYARRPHVLPARPSTSSGVPDPTTPRTAAPFVVTSPFTGASPVPVRFCFCIAAIRHRSARQSH